MALVRFSLVVTNAQGRRLFRLGVGPGRLLSLALGLTLLIVVGLLGAWRWRLAILSGPEVRDLALSNLRLSQSLTSLRPTLGEIRASLIEDTLAISHLYGRSGLGVSNGPTAPDEAHDNEGLWDANHLLPVEAQAEESLRQAFRAQDRAERIELAAASLTEQWRDAERRLNHTPSIRPARTPWLTSSFGVRSDPLLGHWVMHKGLDLGGPVGMLILAPADGTVVWTGLRGGYGQLVVVDHGWGLQTHFAHLSRALVKRGDRVIRGMPIAEMGSSGRSTGPHLHYEVRQDGVPLDPRRFILD